MLASVLFAASISSCDDGRIYEQAVAATGEGRTIKVTGTVNGINQWSEDYSIVIAGFNAESQFAVVSKIIPASSAGGEIELCMSGITEDVTTVELCAINKLRRRIAGFAKLDCTAADADTLLMKLGTVDAGMFHAVQTQIFDANCTACHGKSTSAAAGLYLTEGKSYEALVNKNSTIQADRLLVKPGDASESFLHLILNANGLIRHDHLDILSAKPEMLSLIDNWINNGANN